MQTGHVWVEGSRSFRAFDDFLLSPETFATRRKAGELGLAVVDRFDDWRDEKTTGMGGRAYGAHSMRRTKAAQIYREAGNLRAVQLLLGRRKLESTVRHLGIEVDDALALSEQVEF